MAEEKQMTLEEVQNTEVQEVPKEDVKQQSTTEIVEMNNMDAQKIAPVSESVFTNLVTFKDAFMIGKYFAQSNLVPQAYQGKPMDCAIAVDIANRMGVSPMFVMQNLWVVRGIPSWSGQACMGIIKACGRYKNVKYVLSGEMGKDNRTCCVSAIEIDSGEEIVGAPVSIEMAKKEGWYGKSGSKWQTMPEIMLRYRAATFFARLYCPNELMGFKVEGETEDISKPEQPERKPVDISEVMNGTKQ